MTSVAGNMMTKLNFPGKMLVEKENGEFLGVRMMMMKKKKEGNRRMSLILRSGSGESSGYGGIGGRSLEKVNGRHVAAAEDTTMMMKLGGNNKNNNELGVEMTSLHGKFVEEKYVYRQIFVIRSYEIGPDQTATMETIMNFLQETALNHVTSSGIGGNGFGATREMSIRKLIWVVTRIQVQVERYSSWGDVIEVDTWVDAAGKNGMRRDWIIRDHYTKDIITRATSTWVIMNRETRRLCKIPEEVRQEVIPFYLHRVSIASDQTDSEKIHKLNDETAERIRSGLAPRWNDMDANQHVNNVKYIGWILESVPIKVLEEHYMTSMTLEYRRECRQSNLLESLTSPTCRSSSSVINSNNNNGGSNSINNINTKPDLQFTHLLRLQAGKDEVVRARTEWNLKLNTHTS